MGSAALAATLGEGLSTSGSVAVLPNLGGNAVAAKFAGNGGRGTAQGGPDSASRFTVCMQTVNLDSFVQRQLGVGSAHDNTSYTRCCTCSVNLGNPIPRCHPRAEPAPAKARGGDPLCASPGTSLHSPAPLAELALPYAGDRVRSGIPATSPAESACAGWEWG